MKKILTIIAIMVLCATSVLAVGGAEIKASILRYEPTPAEQGNTVDVWIQLTNAGTKAERVAIKFQPEYPFTLPSGQRGEIDVGVIAATESTVEKFTVYIDPNAPNGDATIEFWYKFGAVAEWNVFEDMITLQSQDSVVVIDEYTVKPSPVVPGQLFEVELTLRNEGRIGVKNVDVAIGIDGGEFSTIGTGAKQRISYIPAGETATVKFKLASDTTTMVRLYSVPVSLTYQDERNKVYMDTARFSLIVNDDPEISLTVDGTDFEKKTKPGTVSLKIVNKGVVDLKYVTVKLAKTGDYDILSPSNEAYVGNLDNDDFESVEFIIKPLVKEPRLQVVLEFKDPYNTPFMQSHDLPLRIITAKELGKEKSKLVPILLTVLVIAGIWYWRKKKKKRK